MPSPRASLDALRALSALFLLRVLRPALFMITVLMVAGYVLTIMLTLSFSSWWLLLLFILIPLTLIFLVVGAVLWFLLQRILPRKLSSEERSRLNGFTERLFAIAEKTKTPYPILLFLVAKDVVRGKESAFLRGLIGDSKALMKEFSDIQALFRK